MSVILEAAFMDTLLWMKKRWRIWPSVTCPFSETIFGRKRQVPELQHKDKMTQQAGRRIALNTPIQGSAADLMKKAMIDIWREMKRKDLKSKMILQVHDELVFEVPDAEKDEVEILVKERMENVFPLKAPLKVHLS